MVHHRRVRIAGVRGQSAPPEYERLCGNHPKAFGGLRVEVEASEPTELALGADESYSLRLDAAGGVLSAATEWGALRGIETFTQLVQRSYADAATESTADLLLCGLPMSVDDSPTYAWRGLLVDTSRHHLPLATSMLPLIDAMSAMKLNVLHWHLTDSQSFPYGSEAVPELPRHGAYHPSLTYSLGEMRAVVAYAHARGIRVVYDALPTCRNRPHMWKGLHRRPRGLART